MNPNNEVSNNFNNPVDTTPVMPQNSNTPQSQPQIFPPQQPNVMGSQPTDQAAVVGMNPPAAPVYPPSPTTDMQGSSQFRATSRDKIIGVVLGIIGVLGIAGAALMLKDFYKNTLGSAAAPPTINFIVPLLFIYSGYYYIGGLNAARLQKKQGNSSFVKKNYQKFRLVEQLLALLILPPEFPERKLVG